MTSTSRRVRVLFDETAIARRTEELAAAIAAANPENLLVVAVLKGSASCKRMGPVSMPTSVCMMVVPVTVSPRIKAHWIGAAPR